MGSCIQGSKNQILYQNTQKPSDCAGKPVDYKCRALKTVGSSIYSAKNYGISYLERLKTIGSRIQSAKNHGIMQDPRNHWILQLECQKQGDLVFRAPKIMRSLVRAPKNHGILHTAYRQPKTVGSRIYSTKNYGILYVERRKTMGSCIQSTKSDRISYFLKQKGWNCWFAVDFVFDLAVGLKPLINVTPAAFHRTKLI